MEAWIELKDSQKEACWNRFYSDFAFRPHMSEDYAGIREPTPSITYDISIAFAGDDECLAKFESDLNLKALTAWRRCGEMTLFALDWQHPCYRFLTFADFNAEQNDEWKVPTLPNGDYYIFATQDFSQGTFGHPWKGTICVWGQRLIDAFNADRPDVFSHPIRKNGNPIRHP